MYYEYGRGTIKADRHTYEDNTIYLYKDNVIIANFSNVIFVERRCGNIVGTITDLL